MVWLPINGPLQTKTWRNIQCDIACSCILLVESSELVINNAWNEQYIKKKHGWNFEFYKIQEISWLAEELIASHREFFSVEWISNETCDSMQFCLVIAFWSVIGVHMCDYTLSSTEDCHCHKNLKFITVNTWDLEFSWQYCWKFKSLWNDMLCLLVKRGLIHLHILTWHKCVSSQV